MQQLFTTLSKQAIGAPEQGTTDVCPSFGKNENVGTAKDIISGDLQELQQVLTWVTDQK